MTFNYRAVLLANLACALLVQNAFATAIVLNGNTVTPTGVTASSYLADAFDRSPVHTIDNSGLTGNQHAAGSANGIMWTSTGNGLGVYAPDYSPTITYDLGSIKNVTAMDIWNYNENVPASYTNMYLGADRVQVLAGATLGTLAPVGGPVTFTEATGLSNYTGNVMPMTMPGVQYIQFQILSNFDGATFTGAPNGSNGGAVDHRYLTGLSEVKFQVTPEPSTMLLGGLAVVGLLIARRRGSAK